MPAVYVAAADVDLEGAPHFWAAHGLCVMYMCGCIHAKGVAACGLARLAKGAAACGLARLRQASESTIMSAGMGCTGWPSRIVLEARLLTEMLCSCCRILCVLLCLHSEALVGGMFNLAMAAARFAAVHHQAYVSQSGAGVYTGRVHRTTPTDVARYSTGFFPV
jgi:hypothetical protein